jgi:DNA invertase Pin-like site-specific DNA recombinase
MIYAYIRVSTDKRTVENQRFEILKYADTQNLSIDHWVEETISSKRKLADRKLGKVLDELNAPDLLIVSELSRLGRNLMEIMSILHICMNKEVQVHTIKEKYKLGNDINSKVLAFAFSLSAEVERQLIPQRTKEALARMKSEGQKLGRPKGSLPKKTKLSGKKETIKELLSKDIGYSAIGRITGVNRLTVKNFVESRSLI